MAADPTYWNSVTRIDVDTDDGRMDCYVFTPESSGTWPPVILFMDAFGIRPQLAEGGAYRRSDRRVSRGQRGRERQHGAHARQRHAVPHQHHAVRAADVLRDQAGLAHPRLTDHENSLCVGLECCCHLSELGIPADQRRSGSRHVR